MKHSDTWCMCTLGRVDSSRGKLVFTYVYYLFWPSGFGRGCGYKGPGL